MQYNTRIRAPTGSDARKVWRSRHGPVTKPVSIGACRGPPRYQLVAARPPGVVRVDQLLRHMTAPLLVRLNARDRELMLRCVIAPTAPRRSRLAWTAMTHLGGTGTTVVAAALGRGSSCCELARGLPGRAGRRW